MEPNYDIQYDEQGRPFTLVGGVGPRSYLSPVAMGGQAPADTSGFFHMAPQWQTDSGNWDNPINWTNIATLAAGGIGAAAAAPAIAGAFGGGGGGSFAGNSVANTAGHFGGAGAVGAAGGGVGGAAATGAKAGTVPLTKKLLSLGAGAGAGIAANKMAGPAISPEVQQMLAEALRRMMAQRQLFDSVNQMSLAGLPGYAKGGKP